LVKNTLLNIVLFTATIFLFVILTISQGNPDLAQAQKTQDQIWFEQHEGITAGCLTNDAIKEYNEATGQPTEEMDEKTETCNHDMLYMLGVCEQNNDGYSFCDPVRTYLEDHGLGSLDERLEQLSQETIDGINENDWNEDGVTDGSDFVSKPSTQ
jgi:hypothetical protein